MIWWAAIALPILVGIVGLAKAQVVNDMPAPEVVDGDTFSISDATYRLWGVDALEADQVCTDLVTGDDLPFGSLATAMLRGLLDLAPYNCEVVDTDRYGREVARCFKGGGIEIAAILVHMGLAWDVPEYSRGRFAFVQQWAQRDGAGVWGVGVECVTPWEWRRDH